MVTRFETVEELKRANIAGGDVVETAGFYEAGDGGGGLYRVEASCDANGMDAIAADNGCVAKLAEGRAVNYRMFGTVSDGESDDGVQIKRAHQYANERDIPVVNGSGEFWIKETYQIPIRTNVDWGQSLFHIDERYNTKTDYRWIIENDQPTQDLTQDAELKKVLLEKVKPGCQIIPELSRFAGCLLNVEDENDRIGIRAGNYSKSGWSREELLYVEEEGRLVGDIAWAFKDFSSIKVKPCNDRYLIVQGGGFYFSGDSGEGSDERGYRRHGISIERSRTIVREQWMGLEHGRSDDSMHPRSGFYRFDTVYDVTLENIRAMPWEKIREDKSRELYAGTYGIGGARMLNCLFRNLTAEGGPVAWGVFGTNLNKNFRVENCRLNRIDVHFHCWNLYIRDCIIGFKGISVTGGGDLHIENTVRHGNRFVTFRPDYGAKWEGDIRIKGCTFKPSGDGSMSVLSYLPRDFDYQYPIGFGRSILVEDMVIDYGAAPQSDTPCWMLYTVPFSQTEDGTRLVFPKRLTFRNIAVEGREKGVRLLRVPEPGKYDLGAVGGYEGGRLKANSSWVFENVQLEQTDSPGDPEEAHLSVGGDSVDYIDNRALYPRIRFTDCDCMDVVLKGCAASVTFERCDVNTVVAEGVKGELAFNGCALQPTVGESGEKMNVLDASSGVSFTNCTIHPPIVAGELERGMIDRVGVGEGVEGQVHLGTRVVV